MRCERVACVIVLHLQLAACSNSNISTPPTTNTKLTSSNEGLSQSRYQADISELGLLGEPRYKYKVKHFMPILRLITITSECDKNIFMCFVCSYYYHYVSLGTLLPILPFCFHNLSVVSGCAIFTI